jgi:excisionase family DNA binding protein
MIDEYINEKIRGAAREILAEMVEPVAVLKDFRDVEILTLDEAAKVLRREKQLVREACARGELPHQKIGRDLIFPKKTFAAYLSGEWKAVKTDAPPVMVDFGRVSKLRAKVDA